MLHVSDRKDLACFNLYSFSFLGGLVIVGYGEVLEIYIFASNFVLPASSIL